MPTDDQTPTTTGGDPPEQPPGVEVRLATPEEEFYLALADEAYKQSVPRLNEAIARLITLGSALAGGALVFLKDEVCTPWCRVGAAFAFFGALAAAAWGSLPVTASVKYRVADIKRGVEEAADTKESWARAATGLILVGLFVAIIGAVARVLDPLPPVLKP